MFGKSAIIFMVLQFLLGLAKDRLDDPGVKEQVKKFVYDTVPGRVLDAFAWKIVEAAWDVLLAHAKAHAGELEPKVVAEGVFKCEEAVLKEVA